MAFVRQFGGEVNEYESTSQFLPRQAAPFTPAGQNFPRAPHTPPTSIAFEDRSNLAKLEAMIFKHTELRNHFKTVRTYLGLDSWVLEPISYLRQEGFFAHNIAGIDPSVRLPQRRQITDLASVQPSLFESPPTELFNLICRYRQRSGFRDTGILQRLDKFKESWSQARLLKPEVGGKTAPEGQVYKCPSAKCRKTFRKAGHATNHMENHHPEYLQLHPHYQPQQFTIAEQASASASPELDRRSVSDTQSESTSSTRHSSTHSRPVSGHFEQPAVVWPDVADFVNLTPSSPILVAYEYPGIDDNVARHMVSRQRRGSTTVRTAGDRHATVQAQYKRNRDMFTSTESLSETIAYRNDMRRDDARCYAQKPNLSSWESH